MLNLDNHIPQGTWTPYGALQPEREAKKLAGHILLYHRGVCVKRMSTQFLVLVWGKSLYVSAI